MTDMSGSDQGPRGVVEVGDADAVNDRGEQSVWMSPDEVLVLIGWCDRMERDGDYDGLVLDEAERTALWALNCALMRQNADVFALDYDARLAAARERLRPTEE